MFSIDQNCHSLWDTLPKLHALAAKGHRVAHFVEDIDVAFTAMGASVDDTLLHLARERFHRSGGQDWGAALFYSQFLGKLAVELRHWEPLTGLKTKTLAKQLDRSVDELYDEFSPGDTWQLIGSSYVGDRDHHRVIGDLAVREARDFLLDLFGRADADMLRAFPQHDSQERLADWFRSEEALLTSLLEQHAAGQLADLYRSWLAHHVASESVRLGLTSSLFACGADPARTAPLDAFVASYERAAALYNEALAETHSGLQPLDTAEGELPFFAIQEFEGHLVRTQCYLRHGQLLLGRPPADENYGVEQLRNHGPHPVPASPRGGQLPPGRPPADENYGVEQLRNSRPHRVPTAHQAFRLAPDGRIPVRQLREAGVRCLAGKALLLVIQARVGPNGEPLALPYRGSLYMPAAHRLAAKLAANGLLPGELKPVVRVRFRLLDRMRDLDTVIRLPGHLADAFGRSEVPARELAANWAAVAAEAARSLADLRDDASRQRWQAERFPDLTRRIADLEARRREMAQSSCTPEQMSAIWKEIKGLQVQLLDLTLRRIARDWQVRELDYWDSRGALLPWSIALGGRGFYNSLVAEAEVYEEGPAAPSPTGTPLACTRPMPRKGISE
ncbi:MAG: hypothetical protein FJ291_19905 [Planctomycetes bacterium]|nr:hypothetical protein [Planctomycetota bacterium]